MRIFGLYSPMLSAQPLSLSLLQDWVKAVVDVDNLRGSVNSLSTPVNMLPFPVADLRIESGSTRQILHCY